MFEDRRLIWQLKTGRQQALVRIYGKYRQYLLKIAHGLLSNSTQAEDAVQDVFVSLIQAIESLRVDGNLRGYLVRCLINRIKDLQRIPKSPLLPDPDSMNPCPSIYGCKPLMKTQDLFDYILPVANESMCFKGISPMSIGPRGERQKSGRDPNSEILSTFTTLPP